ncbi:hypothetical protein SNE40_001408 [Patella caerulea]|uniref:Uncharacterized protein n=1 Tax=Patella caerulea TaxID=87958 RepID=A0AAN8Q3H3_PATCE
MKVVYFTLAVIVCGLFENIEARICGVPCGRRTDCSSGSRIHYPQCGSCVCSDRNIFSCPVNTNNILPCADGCRLRIRNGCRKCSCYQRS